MPNIVQRRESIYTVRHTESGYFVTRHNDMWLPISGGKDAAEFTSLKAAEYVAKLAIPDGSWDIYHITVTRFGVFCIERD